MGHGDILVPRGEAETSPGRGGDPFLPLARPDPSLPSVPVVALCWGSPACSVPGRKATCGGGASTPSTPPAAFGCPGLYSPCPGGWCSHQEGPNTALPCRKTRRTWRRHCLTASSTARVCPSGASRRPAAIPGPPRSLPLLRPRPGSSSGMRVRRRGQWHQGTGPGWSGQVASSGVGLEPPDTGVPSLSRGKGGPAGLYPGF